MSLLLFGVFFAAVAALTIAVAGGPYWAAAGAALIIYSCALISLMGR